MSGTVRLLERGAALSVDETRLSMKLFLGHVEALRGPSDYERGLERARDAL